MAATKKTPPDTDADPAPDAVTPAESAAAEATDSDKPITVPFRGQDFVIPKERFGSIQWRMALGSARDEKILFETVGPLDADRLVRLAKTGEDFVPFASEFFQALNAAAGWGNS